MRETDMTAPETLARGTLALPVFHNHIDTAARSEDFTVRLIPRLGNYIKGFLSDDGAFRLPSLGICLFRDYSRRIEWVDRLSLRSGHWRSQSPYTS